MKNRLLLCAAVGVCTLLCACSLTENGEVSKIADKNESANAVSESSADTIGDTESTESDSEYASVLSESKSVESTISQQSSVSSKAPSEVSSKVSSKVTSKASSKASSEVSSKVSSKVTSKASSKASSKVTSRASSEVSSTASSESERVVSSEVVSQQEQIVEEQPQTQTITTYVYDTGQIVYNPETGEIIENPIPQNPEIIPPPPSENGYIEEVCRLVNIEREREGIEPIQLDAPLCEASQKRAEEVSVTGIDSHTRPDGSQYYTIFTEFNIGQWSCAENLACGQITPEDVVAAWMNSELHRKNIMNPDYHRLGVGWFDSDLVEPVRYWEQLFTN